MQTDALSRLLKGRQRLPSGQHDLPREAVTRSQRNRLLQATMEVVAEHGYPQTTVAHIIKRAGISRRTFYELFSDKEDCFLAAYLIAHESLVTHILNTTDRQGNWQSQFDTAFDAYLDFLAKEPALSHLFLVETYAAGPRITAERDKAHAFFCRMITTLYKNAMKEGVTEAVPPAICIKGLVGGLNELVASWVRLGRHQRLHELKPALVYMTLSLMTADHAEPYRKAAERVASEADFP